VRPFSFFGGAIALRMPCLDGMAAPRFEGSLMTSLAELRAIEHERIASEQAAIVAEAEARTRAAADAAQREVAAAEAKLAAERAEAIRIAKEREDAERAARMHVEAAEATERARLQAALEHERSAQEMELRRAVIAKQRPKWMVAVTIGAVLAAGALTWFGIDRYEQAQKAQAAEQAALDAKEQAEKEKLVATERLASLQAELEDLDKKVGAAIDQVVAATTAAERQAARDNLERLRKQEAELKAKRDAAAAAAAHKIRVGPVHISDACKKNALAKECM
jgi:hypothetical protein